jgi:hypothetical protein
MRNTSKWGKLWFFGPGKGPAGHARVFGLEMDAKKIAVEANGGILGYIGLQPGGKMEIPV